MKGGMVHRSKYLIVGGGMTADAATHGIREVDADGEIVLIGAEPVAPYNRPPLSKMLWKGESLRQIWRIPEKAGVELRLGRRIRCIDPARKEATDDQGEIYAFDRCLLATGGTPRRLPFGQDSVIYLRTLDDYRRLRVLADVYERFAVVGGGFIGSEIAASLAMNGRQVTLVSRDQLLGERLFPRSLAEHVTATYAEMGVEVVTGTTATGLDAGDDGLLLTVQSSRGKPTRTIQVDAVVAGIGIRPNVDLAREAGLAVDDGILVDRFLRTSHPDIYAAGDAARFFCPALDRQIRIEHEDNANSMGHHAGQAMAGREAPYRYIPFFYSSLFDLDYRIVGELDARLQMVEDWTERYTRGIVYYVGAGTVRGVLLWNVWRLAGAARDLIAEPGPFKPEDLKGRLIEPR
ncbi:MAG: NAD(P)/FAD-dependent oxidoreductase [Candidatus Dormibacteraceae bacterium]